MGNSGGEPIATLDEARAAAEKYHDLDGLYPAIASGAVSSAFDKYVIYGKYVNSCQTKGHGEWSKELLGEFLHFDTMAWCAIYKSEYLSYYDVIKGLQDADLTVNEVRFIVENLVSYNTSVTGLAVVIASEGNMSVPEACEQAIGAKGLTGDWRACLRIANNPSDASWIINPKTKLLNTIVMDNRGNESLQVFMTPESADNILSAPVYNKNDISDDAWMDYINCVLEMCIMLSSKSEVNNSLHVDVNDYLDNNENIEVSPLLLEYHAIMIILHPEMYRFDNTEGSACFAYSLFNLMSTVVARINIYSHDVTVNTKSFIEILKGMKRQVPSVILAEDFISEIDNEIKQWLVNLNSMLANKSFFTGHWPYFYECASRYIVPETHRTRIILGGLNDHE